MEENTGTFFPDPLLESLIGIIENAEERGEKPLDISITLNVGGMLISGDLISKDTYMKNFLFGAFHKAVETIKQEDSSFKQEMEEIEKEVKEKPHNFIHLKNSKFFVPGQLPIPTKQEGALWRGRSSCVDGFILGKLEFTKIER